MEEKSKVSKRKVLITDKEKRTEATGVADPLLVKKRYPPVLDSGDAKSPRVYALKEKALFMYTNKKPFVLTKTGSSYKLVGDVFSARAVRGGFSIQEIKFIKSVKKYIMDNDIADKFIDTDYLAKKIFYIDTKDYVEGEIINDVVEIDINRAYWETAYLMGVISKSIYVRGLEIDKRVRLACLGTLAKRTEEWVFDGNKFFKRKEKRSYETENIWFAICRRVSDVMQECVKIAGDDFVFYWVDGIYVKNNAESIGRIMQCLNKWGYESKTKYIKEIVFHNNHFTVNGIVKGDERQFNYRQEDIGSIKKHNEDIRLAELARSIFNNKRDFIMLNKEEEPDIL